LELNKQAIEFGRKMKEMDSKSAQWIAKDALKKILVRKRTKIYYVSFCLFILKP